jgi:hypothetical protein
MVKQRPLFSGSAIERLDLAHMGTPPVKIVRSESVLHGKSPAVVAAYTPTLRNSENRLPTEREAILLDG